MVEVATGTTKAEFRGHDNVVEHAIFVPPNAVSAISELVRLKVRFTSTLIGSQTPRNLLIDMSYRQERLLLQLWRIFPSHS